MSELKNDLLLRVLKGQPVPRAPVWMMRQAGRYLPEYIKLREKYSFFQRVQTPELACAITLQPVRALGVDAAILFSDILVVPQAMGLEVQLVESIGPILPQPVQSPDDLNRIRVCDVADKLSYVMQAIRLIKEELSGEVPLIGFAGAPWTILCYMVEGRGSKTFDKAKAFCYTQPALAHRVLQMITDTTLQYLQAQVRAGVDAVQLFDSWAGLLGSDDFKKFCLPYILQIVAAMEKYCPVIIFAKGAWYGLAALAASGAAALAIDWCIDADVARRLAGPHVALQGNLDPAKLLLPVRELKKEVTKMIRAFGKDKYIANLGHGILPNVPFDHARAFVDTVKNYRWQEHA